MNIHFIGIGGIGVSALAQYYLSEKHNITGSDLDHSETIDQLKKKGIKIIIGKHQAKNIDKKTDLVIYSPAVQKTNPELKKALKISIKCLSYPEALGQLTKKYFTIAISGTHGKSTTTSMASLVLNKSGLDPTVIIGTKLKEFNNSNFRKGNSKYLIIEADEHFASFLNYWPDIIVLTNIDKDHLDYYKNLSHITKTYKEYINHLPENGVLIINKDNINILKLKSQIKHKINIKNYSLKSSDTKKLKKILKIPGNHNISNALAALELARILKIPDQVTLKALASYKGCWRRLEEINLNKIKIISDFAHHPQEIEPTLSSIREKYKNKKIWCIYQPHQYQRTYLLFKDFVKVFKQSLIDNIIITDIYDVSGRENNKVKKKTNSKKLVEKINRENVSYLEKAELTDFIKKNVKNNDILIIMGAGDIYKIIEKIKKFK